MKNNQQYTGLRDEDGRKVYEGDLMQWGYRRAHRRTGLRVLVLIFAIMAALLAVGVWQNIHDDAYYLRHDCQRNTQTDTQWNEYVCKDRTVFILKSDDK